MGTGAANSSGFLIPTNPFEHAPFLVITVQYNDENANPIDVIYVCNPFPATQLFLLGTKRSRWFPLALLMVFLVVQYHEPTGRATYCRLCQHLEHLPSCTAGIHNTPPLPELQLTLDNQASCLDVSYADTIAQLRDTTAAAAGVGYRQWVYQTCTEFGYFQTSDSGVYIR